MTRKSWGKRGRRGIKRRKRSMGRGDMLGNEGGGGVLSSI